jgi:tRNA acetyltransferase TAN1
LTDYNLLVSCKWRESRECRREILSLLKELGDLNPQIRPTVARGIVGVKTALNPVEAVYRLKDLFKVNPEKFVYAQKIVPVLNWCEADGDSMKEVVNKIKSEIKPGEKWRIEIEKRRYTKYHKIEIIKILAELIKEKVDLRKPDKILRIDIIGNRAGISVLKPTEIFSIVKAKWLAGRGRSELS